jgi:hypothetical protein
VRQVRAEPENVLAFLQGANSCDVELGYKLLVEYDMYHELMALFKSHNQHRRALELLAEHGQSAPEVCLFFLFFPVLFVTRLDAKPGANSRAKAPSQLRCASPAIDN